MPIAWPTAPVCSLRVGAAGLAALIAEARLLANTLLVGLVPAEACAAIDRLNPRHQ